jgi:hypothetical protein
MGLENLPDPGAGRIPGSGPQSVKGGEVRQVEKYLSGRDH